MKPEEREAVADSLEAIAETAAGVKIYAEIIPRYAEAGNVPGLRHAVRCMVAHIRACRGGMQALETVLAARAARDGGIPPAAPPTKHCIDTPDQMAGSAPR